MITITGDNFAWKSRSNLITINVPKNQLILQILKAGFKEKPGPRLKMSKSNTGNYSDTSLASPLHFAIEVVGFFPPEFSAERQDGVPSRGWPIGGCC